MTQRRALVSGVRFAAAGVTLAACFQVELGREALRATDGGIDPTDGGVEAAGAPLARVIVLSGLRPPLYARETNRAATDVWVGGVDRNGHLGGWTNAKPLPDRIPFDDAVMVDGRLTTWAFAAGYGRFATSSALAADAWTLKVTSWSMCHGTVRLHAGALWSFGGDCPLAIEGSTVITRAVLTANNTDLEWKDMAPQALTGARYRGGMVFAKSYAYVLGGRLGYARLDSVEYAAFDDVGFGSFAPTAAMPQPRWLHTVVAARDWIFVFGGEGSPLGQQKTIFRAKIGIGGALEPWESLSDRQLPKPLTGASGFALGDRIFIVGGRINDVTLTDEVVSTTVGPDGSLGSFETHEPLPGPRESALITVDAMVQR